MNGMRNIRLVIKTQECAVFFVVLVVTQEATPKTPVSYHQQNDLQTLCNIILYDYIIL